MNGKEIKNDPKRSNRFLVTSSLEIPSWYIQDVQLPIQYFREKNMFFIKRKIKEFTDLSITFILMKEKSSVLSNLMDKKNLEFKILLLDEEGNETGCINIITEFCVNYYFNHLSYANDKPIELITEWKVKSMEIDI